MGGEYCISIFHQFSLIFLERKKVNKMGYGKKAFEKIGYSTCRLISIYQLTVFYLKYWYSEYQKKNHIGSSLYIKAKIIIKVKMCAH